MQFSNQPLFFAVILLSSVSTISTTFALDEKNKVEFQDPQSNISISRPDSFQLMVNQTASLESDNIKVKFLNVTADSRCPSDVTCIWQGEAKISVNIIKDNQDLGNFILTSRTGVKDLAVQVFDGYSMQVVKIEPYPTSGKKIPISEYIATFAITKSEVLSPHKQFKSGTMAKDVQCKEGLQLVIRAEDESPACVKSSTAITLVLSGWAKPTDETNSNGLVVLTEKDQYKTGETINITITNTGNTRLFPIGWGYSIEGTDGKHYAPSGVLKMMLVALTPGNSIHWTWNQMDKNNTLVMQGKYNITASYTEENTQNQISSSKIIEITR